MFSHYSENSAPYYTTNSSAYPAQTRHNPQANASANYQHWQVSNHQGYPTPHINHSNPMRQTLQPGFPESVAPQKPYADHPKIEQSNIEVIYTFEYKNRSCQFKEGESYIPAIHQLVDDHFTRSLQPSSANNRARSNS